MRVAITGGTGFLGEHLARELVGEGHTVGLVSRGETPLPAWAREHGAITHHSASITDRAALAVAFDGCDAIAHFAGINYERGTQTYERVHCDGTDAVISAGVDRGVDRIVLSSYLRARPGVASGYLASKWAAEEAVRSAPVSATVLKPAAIFGPGDQFLTQLARWLQTIPLAPRVGLRGVDLRPVAVTDVVRAATTALVGDAMRNDTTPLLGPETVGVGDLANRIADAIDRRVVTVPTPEPALRAGGWVFERTIRPPVMTRAGVRMLAEGMTAPAPPGVCEPPPEELTPTQSPSVRAIEATLDDVPALGRADLVW